MGEGSSTIRGQEHHHHRPHTPQERQAAVATAAYHISRATDPISAIVSPAPLYQASIVLEEPYHVSRNVILQTDKFQKQHQQHHKVVERSGAGLEEIIMGCTSADNKRETSIRQSGRTEWLEYSYWSPDNPNHHG